MTSRVEGIKGTESDHRYEERLTRFCHDVYLAATSMDPLKKTKSVLKSSQDVLIGSSNNPFLKKLRSVVFMMQDEGFLQPRGKFKTFKTVRKSKTKSVYPVKHDYFDRKRGVPQPVIKADQTLKTKSYPVAMPNLAYTPFASVNDARNRLYTEGVLETNANFADQLSRLGLGQEFERSFAARSRGLYTVS